MYEGSRLSYRGPAGRHDRPYIAALGGSETFGRYVAHPFSALLADWLDMPVLNLGVCNAGISLYSEERWLLDVASRSEVAVLQVLGAQNMSNRLYSVHSRRNDRFLAVSPALREVFPDVDFTEFSFTGHLLQSLAACSPAAFAALVAELQWAWLQRMHRLLSAIRAPVVLLWMAERRPEDPSLPVEGAEPLFVNRRMLDEISPGAAAIVEVVGKPAAGSARLAGKQFPPEEAEAAAALPGPALHREASEKLAECVAALRQGLGPLDWRASA